MPRKRGIPVGSCFAVCRQRFGPDAEPLADKLAKLRRYADDVIAKLL